MAQEHRIYQAIGPVSTDEAEAALVRNDASELLLVAIGVGLHSEDQEWSEAYCLRLATHPHFNVRGNAILSFGHLARRFRKVINAQCVEAIRHGLADADEYVRAQANAAADDIEWFAKLRVRPPADGPAIARESCPCCDYVSLPDRGNYAICPVCFWEDDGLDVEQLDEHSGPNHITLREGRANFASFGACDEKMVPNVCSATERSKFERRPRNVG